MQDLTRIKMEIRPNFGAGVGSWLLWGLFFFFREGSLIFTSRDFTLLYPPSLAQLCRVRVTEKPAKFKRDPLCAFEELEAAPSEAAEVGAGGAGAGGGGSGGFSFSPVLVSTGGVAI